MKKTIYLVRHGESVGNAGPIGNSPATPLTENGRKQANLLAERCMNLPIDTIICSTLQRARDTAEIILDKLHKPIEYSELFSERRRSSVILGKTKDDQGVLKIEQTIRDNFHFPGFRHSDEENFEDLKKRARQALAYLVSRPEENILIVTHGIFLRVLLAYLVFDERLTGEECRHFMRTLGTENTGISVFLYDDEVEWRPWQLWIWNDHAHLG